MPYDWNQNWIDLYQVLEIPREATNSDIKNAYHTQMRKYHPDGYASASEEEQKFAKQKTLEIRFAYDTLINEQTKAAYDSIYDKKYKENKNQTEDTSNGNEDRNYEETMKDYSEAAKRQAERLSIEKIIRDVLAQEEEYFKHKNSFLAKLFRNEIDKDNYVTQLIALQTAAYNYLSNLEELEIIAYEYELTECVNLIEETIKRIQKEFDKLPSNVDEIAMYKNRETIKNKLTKDFPLLKHECNEFISKTIALSTACHKKTLIPMQFNCTRKNLYQEIKNKLDDIENLIQICTELELIEERKELFELNSSLTIHFAILPLTYEEAAKQGVYLELHNQAQQYTQYLEELTRIIQYINNNPFENNCEYFYAKGKEIISKLTKLYVEMNQYYNKVETENGLSKQINKLKENILAALKQSGELYKQIQELNLSNIDEFIDNQEAEFTLPSNTICEVIKNKLDLQNLLRVYKFIRQLQIELPYEDEIKENDALLEQAIRKARQSKAEKETVNSTENNNFKNFGNTKEETTTTQQDSMHQQKVCEDFKDSIFFHKKGFSYPLTTLHLRNYINTHKLENITIDTLYQYFGNNIYNEYEKLFLPHLICAVKCISVNKKLGTLRASFQAMNPNMGNLEPENINYFQYACLNWKEETDNSYITKKEFANQLLEMYKLGIQNGMNKDYRDTSGYTNAHYLLANLPVSIIDYNYQTILEPENCLLSNCELSPADVFKMRTITAKQIKDYGEKQVYINLEGNLKQYNIFRKNSLNFQQNFIILLSFLEQDGTEKQTEIYKTFEKIYTYCKSMQR